MLSFVLLFGCTGKAPPAGPPPEMPPADVGVVTVKVEQVTLQAELAGRTTAALVADLRPQVTGIIKARTFEEGALVKAGQVLYRIDPAMYSAVVAQATADLASARASLGASKTKHERYEALARIGGVSKQEADDARSAMELAAAGVAQKEAALQVARINLDYTGIKAPISGRIGKSSVTVGALVTAGQPAPLATIRSLDPIFVDLAESSEARLRLRAQLGAGAVQAGSAKVKVKLGDGSIYPHEGTLEFSEVAVDEATGTVTLRAQFPNPDDTLLPGMYVRAMLDQAVDQAAMLVPQQGITRDAKGNATAMVVGPGNKAELRTLVADRVIGDRWLVSSGLRAGDQVIVEGLNKIFPGRVVKPSEVTALARSPGPASSPDPAPSPAPAPAPAASPPPPAPATSPPPPAPATAPRAPAADPAADPAAPASTANPAAR